ncbi:MAG: esterase [Candidatus Saccharibacteria bacterium]|nr:esterase [Candidatus Saccharibacteria bacterium]
MYPRCIYIMNKHVTKTRVRRFWGRGSLAHVSMIARFAVVIGILVIGVVGTKQAAAVQTSTAHCATYTNSDENTACKDGAKGADCNDYNIIYKGNSDANNIIAACQNGLAAQQSGSISDTSTSTGTTNACSNYSGTLLTACQGGATSGCNSATASSNPSAYAACQAGAGQSSNNSLTSSQIQGYNTAMVLNCSQYSGDSSAQAACLAAGLGKNGQPVSTSDCLTNSAYNGSTTLQNACITGASSGQTYLSSLSNSGSTSSSSNPFSSLDQGDQSSNLSQYIDALHSTGSDSKTNTSNAADNNAASYVNGAGKQQPITAYPCSGGSKCPAIIWLDGGGWHADDGTAYCLATGSAQKNCQQGGDSSGGGGGSQTDDSGSSMPPAGGGANARGYTVLNVTYRLGSSGVYYMFEDVMRGIQHVINNAGLYNIDPTKIAVGGDSAGGSLSMRAVASGKSGAKVGIGWSAPTNAYTVLFASFQSFLIGMDHSTCIPTDLAGFDNTTNLLTGGSGDVAQYGQGLSSNDFSSIGIGGSGASSGSSDPIGTITQVLQAAQYAQDTSQNVESISKQLEAAAGSSSGSSGTTGTTGSTSSSSSTSSTTGTSGTSSTAGSSSTGGVSSLLSSPLASGVFNLSSKKLGECLDNFNVLSPALFASPETPPSFLAGFDNDQLVPAQQAYDMVDKLHQLGIKADSLIVPGDPNPSGGLVNSNHLGYDPRFVCKTLDFVDSVMVPDKKHTDDDCVKPSASTAPTASSGSGGSGGSGCTTSAIIQMKQKAPTAILATAKPGPVLVTLAAAVINTPTAPTPGIGNSISSSSGNQFQSQSPGQFEQITNTIQPETINPANNTQPATGACNSGSGTGGANAPGTLSTNNPSQSDFTSQAAAVCQQSQQACAALAGQLQACNADAICKQCMTASNGNGQCSATTTPNQVGGGFHPGLGDATIPGRIS